jgi:hypothetical protein
MLVANCKKKKKKKDQVLRGDRRRTGRSSEDPKISLMELEY